MSRLEKKNNKKVKREFPTEANTDLPVLKNMENYPNVFFPFTPHWIIDEKRILQAIVGKKGWEIKVTNDEIISKWMEELKEQRIIQENIGLDEEKIFKKVIKKLRKQLKYEKHIVEPIDGILQVDNLIKSKLKKKLIKEVSKLENVKEEEKDWHPGSSKKVLDLVHPSLYCHVPYRTIISKKLIKQRGVSMTKWIGIGKKVSEYDDKKGWIPTDVHVDDQGKVKFQSYVNNLHPKRHKKIYSILEDILEEFIPLFEKSLSKVVERYDLDKRVDKVLKKQFKDSDESNEDESNEESNDETNSDYFNVYNEDDYKKLYREQAKKVEKNQYDLKGRNLQIIVKLSNTELKSDNLIAKSFEGGNWHLEGMNEDIVATGIYYYTINNITKSELQFRQAVKGDTTSIDGQMGDINGEGWSSEKIDMFELKTRFSSGDELNQELGSITVHEDRCIVFPNYYQHKVANFGLTDENQDGKRRILVFWLINPRKKKLSTSFVPPQQKVWFIDLLDELRVFGSNFPRECLEIIGSYLDDFMSLSEAQSYRDGLMEERKGSDNDAFSSIYRKITYCEH